jgi:diacylglycerol kinase (ATP)
MDSDTASEVRTTSTTPTPANRLRRQGAVSSRRFLRSFVFAAAGLAYLFRTQRNARVHLGLGAAACAVAGWVGAARAEWAVLVLTIAGVLVLEGLNTALEAIVDLASPRYHPLAKVAKDVAAGMVLIAAIAAVIIGLLILGPPVWQRVAP